LRPKRKKPNPRVPNLARADTQHMNALATTQTDTAATKRARTPRISPAIRSVAKLVTSGECQTIKAASERVGLAYDYVRQELKKPAVRVFCEELARQTIANGLMRGSARLVGLMDASSEHVSLDATKHVLGIAGIKPANDAQVSVNIDIKAGYVIDLTGDQRARSSPDAGTTAKVINGIANESG
jgi:hypothetical protein